MLWNFGFRHHPTKQKKWIEGTASLATLAKLSDKQPKVDPVEQLFEDFLAEENPQMLEMVRKAPPEEREKLIKDLEKNFERLAQVIGKLKDM